MYAASRVVSRRQSKFHSYFAAVYRYPKENTTKGMGVIESKHFLGEEARGRYLGVRNAEKDQMQALD